MSLANNWGCCVLFVITAAGGTMTCASGLIFRNTGNVRVSFTGVTSAASAVATGCLVTDLMPNTTHTCDFTQPMSQAFLEAGVATVTLTANGISAQGQVVLTPTLLTRTINPAITQIKTLTYVFERTDAFGDITTNGEHCLFPIGRPRMPLRS